jgi:4-hydroxy-tetrahydrodipicolinate synthase
MIKGLISPILTPFNNDLTLNQRLYNEFAEKLLDNGCSGLAPFGTTGEALSVGNRERMNALEGLVKSGVNPEVLIPGTGLCNIPDTVMITQHAMDLGCYGVMMLPPFYYKDMDESGLFNYYEEVIQRINRTNLKIYLYHIPQVAGVGLSIDLVSRLKSKYPAIIEGIKDSSGVWENTEALLGIKDLVVYPGAELPVIEAIKLGAPGCISATANINSKDIGDVINFCHSGNWEEAEKLHVKVKKVRLLFQEYAPIPAQKGILAMMTGDALWNNLRPPFKSLDSNKIEILASMLRNDFDFKF